MPLAIGYRLNNRYQIEAQIGQGGFSAVYKAYDTILMRACAVKENLDISPEAQRQFAREAQILAPLRHPGLPRVFDHFLIEGQGQYLIMDFIAGHSLAEILVTQGPPNEAQALSWVRQICEALSYLHQQSPPIIHRDIKPANIIITPENEALLVDFGISKTYQAGQQTTLAARRITPGFAPPEQYSGAARTDVRSDIYALGATLYHLLTGQRPPEAIDILTQNVALAPPRQLNPQISQPTEAAVLRAMAMNTTERFQDVGRFQQALEHLPVTVAIAEASPPALLPPQGAQASPPQPQPAAKPPRKSRNFWLIPTLILLSLGLVFVLGLGIANWVVGDQDSGGGLVQETPTLRLATLPVADLPATDTPIPITPNPSATSTRVPTLTPTFSPSATFTPSPSPTPTALGQNCAILPRGAFAEIWLNYRGLIGCPTASQVTIPTIAEELFEGGHLFWRNDTDVVYIIYDRQKNGTPLFAGTWLSNPEWKWDGSDPGGVGLNPPPGRVEPKRGFGWLWRTHLGGETGPLGWALDREYGFDNLGQAQRFEEGVIFKGSDPKVYLLLNDGRFFAR